MNSAPGLELYDSYEADYKQLISSVGKKLDGEIQESRGEQRKAILRRIEMELEEADEILAQMEIEIQPLERTTKSKVQVKLRGYKADLSKRKADVKSLLASVDRYDLLGDRSGPRSGATSPGLDAEGLTQAQAQRARLLAGTDKLSDGQRRLEESHRVALETEDLGAGILGNLRSQREQIEHTRDTLYQADGSIDRASNTLKKMIRRMYQQRVVTALIILVLVILIGFVLWSKFR